MLLLQCTIAGQRSVCRSQVGGKSQLCSSRYTLRDGNDLRPANVYACFECTHGSFFSLTGKFFTSAPVEEVLPDRQNAIIRPKERIFFAR